jgi:hypothetical protein
MVMEWLEVAPHYQVEPSLFKIPSWCDTVPELGSDLVSLK